jgi:hypothetical protein
MSRHSFWFAGNASASLIGSGIAYGILHYTGPLSQWKVRMHILQAEATRPNINRCFSLYLASSLLHGLSYFGSFYLILPPMPGSSLPPSESSPPCDRRSSSTPRRQSIGIVASSLRHGKTSKPGGSCSSPSLFACRMVEQLAYVCDIPP